MSEEKDKKEEKKRSKKRIDNRAGNLMLIVFAILVFFFLSDIGGSIFGLITGVAGFIGLNFWIAIAVIIIFSLVCLAVKFFT